VQTPLVRYRLHRWGWRCTPPMSAILRYGITSQLETKLMNVLLEIFRKPTPLRIATAALEQSERDRLTAVEQREYYAAMEEMLMRRITRLRREVVQLTQEAESAKKDLSGG